MLVWHSLNLTI